MNIFKAQRKEYEYATYSITNSNGPVYEELRNHELNEYALQGWRVVTCFNNSAIVTFVLEREIK